MRCPGTWESRGSGCPPAGGWWGTARAGPGTGVTGSGGSGRAVGKWSPWAGYQPATRASGDRTKRPAGELSTIQTAPPTRETGSTVCTMARVGCHGQVETVTPDTSSTDLCMAGVFFCTRTDPGDVTLTVVPSRSYPVPRYEGTWNRGKLTDVGTLQTLAGKCFEVVWRDFTPNIYISQNCH